MGEMRRAIARYSRTSGALALRAGLCLWRRSLDSWRILKMLGRNTKLRSLHDRQRTGSCRSSNRRRSSNRKREVRKSDDPHLRQVVGTIILRG